MDLGTAAGCTNHSGGLPFDPQAVVMISESRLDLDR
jgi:hypothetical protein